MTRPTWAAPKKKDFPSGFDTRSGKPTFFDPALKHIRNGLRVADDVHETLLLEVLQAITRSSFPLILRGGMAMRAWFGSRARPPRDIDFIWGDPELRAHAADGALFDIAAAVVGSVAVEPEVGFDSIWTYERVEGRRLTFFGDRGSVQVDFVFGERVQDAPSQLPGLSVLGASQRESLAWKLYWVATDKHLQGKDVYDATVLAEAIGSVEGLVELCAAMDSPASAWGTWADFLCGDDPPLVQLVRRVRGELICEWAHFRTEYPHLAGDTPEALGLRFERALLGLAG